MRAFLMLMVTVNLRPCNVTEGVGVGKSGDIGLTPS